jgi:hypothetical protein
VAVPAADFQTGLYFPSRFRVWPIFQLCNALGIDRINHTRPVPVVQAITKCRIFQKNAMITAVPYRVQSPVIWSILRECVAALKGKKVEITDGNIAGLGRWCAQFDFEELSAKLSKFLEGSNDLLDCEVHFSVNH